MLLLAGKVLDAENACCRVSFTVKTLAGKVPLLACPIQFFLILGTLGKKAVTFVPGGYQSIHMRQEITQRGEGACCNDINIRYMAILNPDVMDSHVYACFT